MESFRHNNLRYCYQTIKLNQSNLEKENSKTAEVFSNVEAEQALIGAILWDNKNYEKVADFLEDKHFVEPNNQIIFKTISMLLNKNMLVSPITLKSYLPSNDFDFNVIIRSILYNDSNKYVSFSVGSAITSKSIPNLEYDECLIKAKAMHLALNQ